jgi:hypothetical protein
MYPDFKWLPWKFVGCPPNYWENEENRINFVKWAEKELKIKEIKDWYKVTSKVEKASF